MTPKVQSAKNQSSDLNGFPKYARRHATSKWHAESLSFNQLLVGIDAAVLRFEGHEQVFGVDGLVPVNFDFGDVSGGRANDQLVGVKVVDTVDFKRQGAVVRVLVSGRVLQVDVLGADAQL